MGDDSVSYLVLACWIAGEAGPLLMPWLPWHIHFGPLFPLPLAMTGGGSDLVAAHLVVAGFAALSVLLLARYAAAALGSDAAEGARDTVDSSAAA